jgi:hypothetical protein
MNLKRTVQRMIPMRWRRVGKDDPLSMVLLLRTPHFFRDDELRSAAERAWRVSFAGGPGSLHAVAQSKPATLLKAGPHLLSLFHYPKPYFDNPGSNVDWLPQTSQRRAWAEHTACVGVDYMNPETDVELGYCVLAKLVAEMLDENCTAVYIPREIILIPHDQSLYTELLRMASTRDPGIVTGKKP